MRLVHRTSGYMPPDGEVYELSYKGALQVLNEHLKIPTAPNSRYGGEQLVESLVYLTVEKAYAESGLQNLACTREAPSADTLLRRVKGVAWRDAYGMLVEANDHVVGKLRRRGIFRKAVLAAADLSDDPYYGSFNSKVCRGRYERGTCQFYRHASLHVVEAGKRVTVFTVMVTLLDDHASIIETLIRAARERGIRIGTLLVDRGFYGVDVVNRLKHLRQGFLMPAVKHRGVKRAIEDHDRRLTPAVIEYTIMGAENRTASCRLFMHAKRDADPADPAASRYHVFATNMSVGRVILAYNQLPEEYRRRWGIETGFRVQDGVQAKTTSGSYTVRVVYTMLSTILYNIWVLANVRLARRLGVEFKRPRIKLSQLAHHFSMQISQLKRPP